MEDLSDYPLEEYDLDYARRLVEKGLVSANNLERASRLFKKEDPLGLELQDACFTDIVFARALLATGRYDANWRDCEFGVSLLQSLSFSDHHTEALKVLLAYNAHPNIKNNNGETALHWAASMNCLRAATQLLDGGAEISLKDNSNSTSLHRASACGNPEMVSLLLARGCSLDCVDRDGQTALDVARSGATTTESDLRDGQIAAAVLIQRHLDYIQGMGRGTGVQIIKQLQQKTIAPVIIVSRNDQQTTTRADLRTPPFPQAGQSVMQPLLGKGSNDGRGATIGDMTIVTSVGKGQRGARPVSAAAHGNRTRSKRTSSPVHPRTERDPESELNFKPDKPVSGRMESTTQSQRKAANMKRKEPAMNGGFESLANLFPPADFVPFIPHCGRILDVVISVEQCCDCANHTMSLWHDSKRYSAVADKVLAAVVRAISEKGAAVRVLALKARATDVVGRLGALEVTMAIKVGFGSKGHIRGSTLLTNGTIALSKPASETRDLGKARSELVQTVAAEATMLVGERAGLSADEAEAHGWVTHTLHSKLASSWWGMKKKYVFFIFSSQYHLIFV